MPSIVGSVSWLEPCAPSAFFDRAESSLRLTPSEARIAGRRPAAPGLLPRGSSPRAAHDDGANRFPAVPCFRMVARPTAVKLCGQKILCFHYLTESATSCVQAGRGKISRESGLAWQGKNSRITGKEQGITGGGGEPAKATRLRLYRRRPKAPPAVEQKLPSTPRGQRISRISGSHRVYGEAGTRVRLSIVGAEDDLDRPLAPLPRSAPFASRRIAPGQPMQSRRPHNAGSRQSSPGKRA